MASRENGSDALTRFEFPFVAQRAKETRRHRRALLSQRHSSEICSVTQTPLKLPLNGALRQGENILKIFPVSLEGCYGARSHRSDDHAKKENTLRAGSN
jgi:hypothetical protein